MHRSRTLRRACTAVLAMAALAIAPPSWAHGHPANASQALSGASALAVGVSVAAPFAIVASGAAFTVLAVEASAEGTVWIVEGASDGARASLQFAGAALGDLSVGVGTVIMCMAVSTGWVLSSAGRAIAFVPNAVGVALLHHERISR